jgi:hypothetical protein
MTKSEYIMTVYKPPKSYLLKYIWKKLYEDHEDFILLVVGKRGKGKSYASLRIGETHSNNLGIPFTVADNVKYTVKSMLNSVNSLVHAEGSCIVMEEAGVHANARKFMAEVNMALNFFTQTVRTRHYLIIFNLPKSKMTDFSVRSLASARLEIIKKDKQKMVSVGKLYLLDYDEFTKKEWRRFLRIRMRGQRKLHCVKAIEFALPSEQIIKDYEVKKKAYTAQLYKDLEGSIGDEMGEIELENSNLEDTPTASGVNLEFVKKMVKLVNEYGLKANMLKEVTGYKPGVIRSVLKFAKDQGMYVRKSGIRREEFDLYGVEAYKKAWKELIRVKEEEEKLEKYAGSEDVTKL